MTKCKICWKNKRVTKPITLSKGTYDICPDCIEYMKWTQACMRLGTDWLVKKHPDKYVKTSQFSVTAI